MVRKAKRRLATALRWAVGVVVIGSLAVGPVQCQSRIGSGQQERHIEKRDPGQRVGDVPSWAESSNRSPGGGRNQAANTGDATTNATPPPPDDPDSLPVDGGLIWLVLAGGGYAGWKLGFTEERFSA